MRFRGTASRACAYLAFALITLPFAAPAWAQAPRDTAAKVDGAFIQKNAGDSKSWPSIGLDYAETRFSKLKEINSTNVKELGLAWSYNLESTRGVEATPLVVDGVMYVSASWSIVHRRRHGPEGVGEGHYHRTQSTCAPASGCGCMIRKCRASTPSRAVAMS